MATYSTSDVCAFPDIVFVSPLTQSVLDVSVEMAFREASDQTIANNGLSGMNHQRASRHCQSMPSITGSSDLLHKDGVTNWRSGQLSVRFLPRIKDQGLMRDSDAGKAIMNRDSLSGTILYRVREFPGERLSRTHSPGQRLSHCEILGWFLPPSQRLGYSSRTGIGKGAWQPNVVWRLHIRTANKHGSAPTSAVRMALPPHDALLRDETGADSLARQS